MECDWDIFPLTNIPTLINSCQKFSTHSCMEIQETFLQSSIFSTHTRYIFTLLKVSNTWYGRESEGFFVFFCFEKCFKTSIIRNDPCILVHVNITLKMLQKCILVYKKREKKKQPSEYTGLYKTFKKGSNHGNNVFGSFHRKLSLYVYNHHVFVCLDFHVINIYTIVYVVQL